MTSIEQKMLDALIACRDRFVFYVGHHLDKGDLDKAAESEKFVSLANDAIAAANQSEPPNFCPRCGKRLMPEGVHTCTPPMHHNELRDDAPWKAAIIDQLVIAHILTSEHETNPRKAIHDLLAYEIDLAVDPLVSEAAVRLVERSRADEREACLRCYSPDDTADDWADKIRARGQQ